MDLPVPFPMRGLHEGRATSKTPALHSIKEKNVRGRNCVNGRYQGAKRPGHERFCSTQLFPGQPVKALGTIIHDVANITFSNTASPITTSTGLFVPANEGKRIKTDIYGNVYAIDGRAGLVIFTPKLVTGSPPVAAITQRINFPTAEDDHQVRAFWVNEFRELYAAVSFGSNPSTARLWKYEPDLDQDGKLVLAWTHAPGGLVTDMHERDGRLYYVVNFPETGKSHLVALAGLDRSVPPPIVVFRQPQLPYPTHALDVRSDDGMLFTTSPPNSQRGKNPQCPDADATFVSWTPRDFTDFDERVFSWHTARNIDGVFNTSLAQGDSVTRWLDISGHGRHYYAVTGQNLAPSNGVAAVTTTAPTFDQSAQAGLPGIRFNGLSDLLQSAANLSTEYAARDAQKTTVPAHRTARTELGAAIADTGSAYLMCLLVKVDLDQGQDIARFLWSQEDADVDPTTGTDDRHIFVNKTSGALTAAIAAADKGRVFVYEQTNHTTSTGGHGPTTNFPASLNAAGDAGLNDPAGAFGDAFDNTSGLALITYLCDGGFRPATYTTAVTHSQVRLNGRPIDRFASNPNYTLEPDAIGGTLIDDANLPVAAAGAVNRFFKGWLLEKIVLTRKTISVTAPTTEDILLEHAKYGNSSVPVAGDTDWPGAAVQQSDNELTKLEGYFLNEWGKRSAFPSENDAGIEYGHPYRSKVPLAPSQPALFNVNNLQVARGILAKWDGDSGAPIWSFDALSGGGGVGYDVKATVAGGNVYSYGPSQGTAALVRAFADGGTQPTAAWSSALGTSETVSVFDDQYPKMAVDQLHNVYVPVAVDPLAGTAPSGDVVVLNSAGTVLVNVFFIGGQQTLMYSVALPPEFPPYPSSLTNQRASHIYFNSVNGIVRRAELVTQTVNTGAPRIETHVAVGGNGGGSTMDLKTFNDAGTVATPTGGASVCALNTRHVELIPGFEKIFVVTGGTPKYFDPITNTVLAWEATKGEIPPRQRIGCLWNGRIVLGRGDDPDLIFMCAKGDPFNWDRLPGLQTVTQAIFVEDLRLGHVPDIVTALIPDKDRLIIGCDHSIRVIVGEPILNDQYGLISDQVGIAWNSSWTKDPEGNIYFYEAQEGRVRVIGSGSGAVSISDAIPSRLRSIDLSVNFVKLEWSTEYRGMHVYVVPIAGTAPSAVIECYFWERDVDAWHVDTWKRTTEMPFSALSIDGDLPGDRVLLVGGAGGYVYKESAANDDDGQQIDSYFDVDLTPPDPRRETRITGVEVVLTDSGGRAIVDLFGSNEPDVFGAPRASRKLKAGRNSRWNAKVKAAHVRMRIGSAATGERWAFESCLVRAFAAGRLKSKARESTVGAT